MSDRDRAAVPNVYHSITAVLGDLLGDIPLREIVQTTREVLQAAFAALSFAAPGFSSATTIFVRDSLVMPEDFAPCADTAVSDDVFAPRRNHDQSGPGQHAYAKTFSNWPAWTARARRCFALSQKSRCFG